jgi:hypothetical protein
MCNTLAIIEAIMLVYMCKRIGLKAVKNIDLIFSAPDPTELNFGFHFISYFLG